MIARVNQFFQIKEKGSSLRTEILGGATIFLTMAYVIVVNPAILANAQVGERIPVEPLTVATILATVFGCLFMGLYANRPIAVAPYMGENAFIAFSLTMITVNGQPITFEQRLGTVFVSGVAFFVLTLLGLRRWLADAVSPSMKHSFAVGIGLFLFLVGVTQTGIVAHGVTGTPVAALPTMADKGNEVVGAPSFPPVKIGDVTDPRVLLAIGGFLLITTLMYWRIRGGILLGIFVVGAAGYWLGLGPAPEEWYALPWEPPYDVSTIAFNLDILSVLQLSFFPILLTLFLISFLDTLGTLVAVGSAGGMLDQRGNFPEMEKPMLVDSISCMFSAVVGTSTSGAYIESTTGVREGARTGLAAVVTGLLFGVSLFLIPLFTPLQRLTFAYGPALMAVGVLMIGAVVHIRFDDLTEAVPCLTTITMMLFTFNIANGLTAGLLLYPLFKILTGRWKDLSFGSVLLGGMCALYFVFGLPH